MTQLKKLQNTGAGNSQSIQIAYIHMKRALHHYSTKEMWCKTKMMHHYILIRIDKILKRLSIPSIGQWSGVTGALICYR